MEATLADIIPHLSDRGEVEVNFALAKVGIAQLHREVALRDQIISRLQASIDAQANEHPCNCAETVGVDGPLEFDFDEPPVSAQ